MEEAYETSEEMGQDMAEELENLQADPDMANRRACLPNRDDWE